MQIPLDENKMGSVQAIDRAFLVLETVAKNGPLSINDLHNKLGLNKASLSRIASTLCRNGYLNRDIKTGDFSLSLRAFEVGVNAMRNLDYISLIKSALAELASSLNVVAQFSVEDHNELLCLESFDQQNTGFSIYTRVGQRTPLYSTSAGKAILSTYSNEEIIDKWAKMEIKALTANTITDVETLLVDIAQIRQRNYALDLEESEPRLFCIGTVLLNYNRKPIGAISLSTNSMTEGEQLRYSEALLQRVQRVSNMLGYTRL
ncbi:IclR family transcriptional regulator [Acetonema longum]|uniref:Transcriptional regulator n=1 Tax=Acetonema longum DSM 6540 TaxID=1009370 RepID=F7NF11_9FIRM|nr:IclR family transcriptional regulator [Acetonema longum]EGO65572.1 transcriptional regulator [Acetonema longum DSM 6540]